MYALVIGELLPRLPRLEKKVPEPYLSQMRLVFVGGVDLFDRVKRLRLEVESLPHLRKASPSQLLSFQVALDKGPISEHRLRRSFEYAVRLRMLRLHL